MTEYIRGLIGPAGKYNLHTHTAYCDGKNKPEEMIRKALELDFTLLGFSGHGFAPHDDDVCISPEGEEAYRKEILELREKYRDRLDIRLGLERDFYTEDSIQDTGVQPPSDFDKEYVQSNDQRQYPPFSAHPPSSSIQPSYQDSLPYRQRHLLPSYHRSPEYQAILAFLRY